MRVRHWSAIVVLGTVSCSPPPAAPAAVREAIASKAEYDALPTLALEDLGSACGVEEEPCATPGFKMAVPHDTASVAFWGVDGKRPQLYSTDGTRLLRLGRQGSGPGEYRMPLALGVSADGGVLAADILQRRVLRYGTDGSIGDAVPIAIPLAIFDFAFVGDRLRAFATTPAPTSGDSMPVEVHALDGGAGATRRLFTLPVRQPSYRMDEFRPIGPVFAPHAQFRFRGDGHLFVSTGDTFVVEEFDSTGVRIARFGFDVAPRAVSKDEVDEERRRMARFIPDAAMREAMIARMQASAARHPAITALVPLPDGSLWVRESPAAAADSVQWIVYRAPAEPSGRLLLDSEESVITARGDRLLVARADPSAGVTMLRWMRLRPTP
jgi:hypothetical protein